MLKSFQPR
jgi:hypothetical protein